MASKRPFEPSPWTAEKRTVSFTFRMTGSEHALLEREAEKRGVTVLNLIRQLIADGLIAPRKSKRR